MKKFSKYFDHTLLKPDASSKDIAKLCSEAVKYDFASVCVNGCRVAEAAEHLTQTDVKVAAVVGFPLGAGSSEVKLCEATKALDDGASEIDMVINIGAVKDGNFEYVKNEIATLADLCHEYAPGAILKTILETCLLTDEEIINSCHAAMEGHADFVKTSTGFGTGGATVSDVRLMKNTVGDKLKVKASGGIRTPEEAQKFIKAGADRLGCSSSCEILKKYQKIKN